MKKRMNGRVKVLALTLAAMMLLTASISQARRKDGDISDKEAKQDLQEAIGRLSNELSGKAAAPQSRSWGHYNAQTTTNIDTFTRYLAGTVLMTFSEKPIYAGVDVKKDRAVLALGVKRNFLAHELVGKAPKFDLTHTYFARKKKSGKLKSKRKITVSAENFGLHNIKADGKHLSMEISGKVKFKYYTKPGKKWRERIHGTGDLRIKIPMRYSASTNMFAIEGFQVKKLELDTNAGWLVGLLTGGGGLITSLVAGLVTDSVLEEIGKAVANDKLGNKEIKIPFKVIDTIDKKLPKDFSFKFKQFRLKSVSGGKDAVIVSDWEVKSKLNKNEAAKKVLKEVSKLVEKIRDYLF